VARKLLKTKGFYDFRGCTLKRGGWALGGVILGAWGYKLDGGNLHLFAAEGDITAEEISTFGGGNLHLFFVKPAWL